MNCMGKEFPEFVAQLLHIVNTYDSKFDILFNEGKTVYRLIVDKNRWNNRKGYLGTLTFQTISGTIISSVTVYSDGSETNLLKDIKTKIYIFRRRLKTKNGKY